MNRALTGSQCSTSAGGSLAKRQAAQAARVNYAVASRLMVHARKNTTLVAQAKAKEVEVAWEDGEQQPGPDGEQLPLQLYRQGVDVLVAGIQFTRIHGCFARYFPLYWS